MDGFKALIGGSRRIVIARYGGSLAPSTRPYPGPAVICRSMKRLA